MLFRFQISGDLLEMVQAVKKIRDSVNKKQQEGSECPEKPRFMKRYVGFEEEEVLKRHKPDHEGKESFVEKVREETDRQSEGSEKSIFPKEKEVRHSSDENLEQKFAGKLGNGTKKPFCICM